MYIKSWIKKFRTLLTIIVLCIYILLFYLYLWELSHGLSYRRCALFYNYLTLVSLLFFVVDSWCGICSILHKYVNYLGLLSIAINFVVIILIHHTMIKGVEQMFRTFNIMEIVTIILMIYITRNKKDLY